METIITPNFNIKFKPHPVPPAAEDDKIKVVTTIEAQKRLNATVKQVQRRYKKMLESKLRYLATYYGPMNHFIVIFNEAFRAQPDQDRYTIHVHRLKEFNYESDGTKDWENELDGRLREVGYKVLTCEDGEDDEYIYEIGLVSLPDHVEIPPPQQQEQPDCVIC